MITKDKTSSIISISFVFVIAVFIYNLTKHFEFIDFAYLLFLVGCFIRYIYIKTH